MFLYAGTTQFPSSYSGAALVALAAFEEFNHTHSHQSVGSDQTAECIIGLVLRCICDATVLHAVLHAIIGLPYFLMHVSPWMH